MNFKYCNLINRNSIFVNDSIQEKIKSEGILFAGCGLGSAISTLAVRTGFTKIKLCDGDVVEIHNLNRQFFHDKNIGKNKTEELSNNLKSINPNCDIEKFPFFIDVSTDINTLFADYKYIVNTVDNHDVAFLINNEAIKRGRTILFPFIIGYGAYLLVFDNTTISLQDMVKNEDYNDLIFYKNLLESCTNLNMPGYIIKNQEKIMNSIKQNKKLPQLGIASFLTASLVVTTIVKLISKKEIRKAPNIITTDMLEL